MEQQIKLLPFLRKVMDRTTTHYREDFQKSAAYPGRIEGKREGQRSTGRGNWQRIRQHNCEVDKPGAAYCQFEKSTRVFEPFPGSAYKKLLDRGRIWASRNKQYGLPNDMASE